MNSQLTSAPVFVEKINGRFHATVGLHTRTGASATLAARAAAAAHFAVTEREIDFDFTATGTCIVFVKGAA